jgi:hypothetical protein
MIDRISASVAQAIVDEVATWGRRGVETGGFVLTRNDPCLGDLLVACGTAGIIRRPDQLVISGEALAVLFDYAAEQELVVACQVHSHQYGPRMSPTDQRFGLTVEGFTSVIVPRWSDPSTDPRDWGWWRFNDGRWLRAGAPRPIDAAFAVKVFDEQGVRDV